ncbi:MAG: efflux RND transporter permease subunit [Myxococcales bacterium]|nr:efflux RND transporter permease subunit [Myxococcales bacterium]
MLTLIVLVLGGVSLGRLRIDLLPDVELPTVTIRTEYEGASPEVMEQRVTAVIEEIVATVPGVEEIESSSSEGNSSVKLTFGWGTDVDTAALDVRSTLEDEINELPDDIVRPRVSKFDVASFPVVILGVSSRLDPIELTTLVDEQVRYRLSQIPGVAQVDPWGEYERELRVELDPERVAALRIPLDRIVRALQDANLDLPAGTIERGKETVTLRAPAQFVDLEQIRRTVVAVREGASVALRQIAEVRDTHRKLERLARIDGELGLRLAIRKQSDANTVEVSRAVLAEIEAINRELPQLHIVPVINQGNFIERSIANVARSVVYGAGLAVVVLLFFLRSVRSTAVISVAIPVSLLATFALMEIGGLTINLMTLGGLALGVGMMVDSSIVVLEAIFRRRDEAGEDAVRAAVTGAADVGPAIVASTVTTLVIFLPLVFVGGVAGVLFRDLAIVIAFSLACSLVVSLSVVPMLASRMLRGPGGERAGEARGLVGRLAAGADAAQRRLDDHYAGAVRGALRHRMATVVMAAVALGASLLLLPTIGTEFMPPSDEGEVRITGEMPVGTKLPVVDRQTRRLEQLVAPEVPEALASVVSVGASGRNPSEAFQGEIRITLRPTAERSRSNTEIADALRQRLEGEVAGMQIRTRAPQGQFLLERVLGGEEGLTVEVRGFDLRELDRLARRAAAVVAEVPGVTDVDVSREAGVPQQELRVDRDAAASLGLSPRDVAQALETAVAGTEAGQFRERGSSYRILVQFADAEALELQQILDMTVESPQGEAVALRSVVEAVGSRGPIVIERKAQQRTVRITANVTGRDMGSVAAEVGERLAEIPRPVGYDFVLGGDYEQQQDAFEELLIALALSLALVYMVLAAQYESLRDPLVVMLSVPVAAIGVLVVLAATHTTLNVQSAIGCIMLGGIVVNNAILLVDRAGRRLREGQGVDEAVVEAGRLRLRPILMTTATTVLALLPLALGMGEGADAQAPLARAVLGGLTASTFITLLLVPAVYSLVHRDGSSGTVDA